LVITADPVSNGAMETGRGMASTAANGVGARRMDGLISLAGEPWMTIDGQGPCIWSASEAAVRTAASISEKLRPEASFHV
tara:strand:+ start:1646 stop:1885 length:240 start_codon:yes stop_codon:yes gene_type:complete